MLIVKTMINYELSIGQVAYLNINSKIDKNGNYLILSKRFDLKLKLKRFHPE